MRRDITNRLNLIILFLFTFCITGTAFAQNKKILIIGNSYTYYNDMPRLLQDLLNQNSVGGVQYKVDAITKGGAKLNSFANDKRFWDSVYKQNKPYDIVFLQEQSLTTLFENEKKLSVIAIRDLSNKFKKMKTEVFIVSTWPRHPDHKIYNQDLFPGMIDVKDEDEMSSHIYRFFYTNSELNKIQHVPLVINWLRCLQTYPNMSLYLNDGSHPSLLGSYLYAFTLYNEIVEKMQNSISITKNISSGKAEKLLKCIN